VICLRVGHAPEQLRHGRRVPSACLRPCLACVDVESPRALAELHSTLPLAFTPSSLSGARSRRARPQPPLPSQAELRGRPLQASPAEWSPSVQGASLLALHRPRHRRFPWPYRHCDGRRRATPPCAAHAHGRAPWPPVFLQLRASLSSTVLSTTLTSSHRPRSAPSSAPLAAGKLQRRSRRGSTAGHRGQAVTSHPRLWQGHLRVRPSTAVLPRRFRDAGEALIARSSELRRERRRLPCFPIGRREERAISLSLSLGVSMTSGPDRTVGPTCRLSGDRVWVYVGCA
jgi:hypothetical protein